MHGKTGGELLLSMPLVKKLRTIDMTDVGMIKRVRGVCHTVAMAPSIANRVRIAANEVIYRYISDVWIFDMKTTRGELQKHVDKEFKNKIGAGYGLSLIAESTSQVALSVHSECSDSDITAEDFGNAVSKQLLDEISFGGTVDTTLQSIILVFMALGPDDVSRVRLGRMSKHSVRVLRLIRDMLGVVFKLREDKETGTIFASCLGVGMSNVWRQAS